MITFDEITPKLVQLFQDRGQAIAHVRPLLVNRDLNGRVRLILDGGWEHSDDRAALDEFARLVSEELRPHAAAPASILLFEEDFAALLDEEPNRFPLEQLDQVYMIDRLVTDSSWATFAASSPDGGASRIVFYSIKGGVGRSTALAAAAWWLAEQGKRVLVLDLDLESPGLSSSLLPEDRRPSFGIVDWLVEDLLDNAAAVETEMVATSALSHNGEIFVVPAHGRLAGDYIAKLGRVWMPKIAADGHREAWSVRLRRMLDALEKRLKPDVILIDSRAGIDEVAATCLTELSPTLVLLFAIDGDQTWSGYGILFRYWRLAGTARQIREHLQVVGAMIPEINREEYTSGLRERSWTLFAEELYDVVAPGDVAAGDDTWSFDLPDAAPHHPWDIRWHRGWAALPNLHGRLLEIDPDEVRGIFGPLLAGIETMTNSPEASHERS